MSLSWAKTKKEKLSFELYSERESNFVFSSDPVAQQAYSAYKRDNNVLNQYFIVQQTFLWWAYEYGFIQSVIQPTSVTLKFFFVSNAQKRVVSGNRWRLAIETMETYFQLGVQRLWTSKCGFSFLVLAQERFTERSLWR